MNRSATVGDFLTPSREDAKGKRTSWRSPDHSTYTVENYNMKWMVLALALFQGGWLVFDGGRALILGDYVTPTSGPRAGQLGPWSRLVAAAGFEPRSRFIKSFHLFLGGAWLIGLATFLIRPASGWWIILFCGVGTLWYLPIGTLASLVVLALLLTPQIRSLL
jgi:hypothetical protein